MPAEPGGEGSLPKLVQSASAPALQAQKPSSPSKLPKLGGVHVKFLPGYHGLEVDGRTVTRSYMQGWMKGVRPGWSVTAINGKEVQDDDDLEALLLSLERSDAKYEIVFQKGGTVFGIGADQAANKADLEKDKNKSRLRKVFPFQGKIERPDHRAITCAQLERVIAYAREHSSKWRDNADAKDSAMAGQRLRMEFFNVHHANMWVIMPATEARKCSFVELVAKQKQVPVWYVNHYWGEPIVECLASLKSHSVARGLTVDTPYWMHAYACRPHGPPDDLQGDVKQTSSFKALKAVHFHMLFLIDKELTAFSRLWCAYEASLCLDSPTLPLDIVYSTSTGSGKVITQGLTDAESALEQRSPGSGIKAKLSREAEFPIGSVLEAALELEIEKCKTGIEEDRKQILNGIAGHGFKIEPVETCPGYDEMTQKLRGLFAGHLLYLATTKKNCQDEEAPKGWNRIANAMTGDLRDYLDIHLEGCTPECLHLLARSIPESLRYVKLRLMGSTISDQNMLAFGDSCTSLKSISMDFRQCSKINMEVMNSQLKKNLKKLKIKSVDVDLAETEALQFKQDVEQPRRNMAKAFGVAVCSEELAMSLRSSMSKEELSPRLAFRAVPLVPALCRAMGKDPKSEARLAAVRVLASLGEKAQSATKAIEKCIAEDEDQDVQKAARLALAKVNGDLPRVESTAGSKEVGGSDD